MKITILTLFAKVTFVLFGVLSTSLQKDLCGNDDSIDISNGTRSENDDIILNNVTYTSREYFIDNGTIRGCICQKRVCVRKCCAAGEVYNAVNRTCEFNHETFRPGVFDGNGRVLKNDSMEAFYFLIGPRRCNEDEFRVRVSHLSKEFNLQQDGSLRIRVGDITSSWIVRSANTFCTDNFITNNSRLLSFDAIACFAEDKKDNYFLLTSSCMLVSCVFILVTVAVYSWLPELRNLQSRVLVAYLLCLFVSFVFLASMQLTASTMTTAGCVGMTLVIYFFLLAAFFWLNVMCFDIWRSTSGGQQTILLDRLSNKAKFQVYCWYAFGVPAACTVLIAALEFSGLPSHPWMPRLRGFSCFLEGKCKLLYLYSPMVLLCVANLVLFILTACNITVMLRTTEVSAHDKHENYKQRLLLCVKLFMVMGINWILEVISSLYPELDYIWRFTDVYNILVGVIIFIIFVCNRRVFRLLWKRYRQCRGGSRSVRTETSSSRASAIQMNSNNTQ